MVRLNTMKGDSDVIELRPGDWTHHLDGDDVAVALLDLQEGIYRTRTIDVRNCLEQGLINLFHYGPGDETFTISRFMTHDGRQTNQPVVRFGNIAMMPGPEGVMHERGHPVESYLVESRSISGMSGSPVFVYIPMIEDFPLDPTRQVRRDFHPAKGPYFLGIDWGHLPATEPVLDTAGERHSEGWRVKSNSGFMAVAPAWKLKELLLEDRKLKMERKALDKTRQCEREDAASSDALS